jgi:hypothetical protein
MSIKPFYEMQRKTQTLHQRNHCHQNRFFVDMKSEVEHDKVSGCKVEVKVSSVQLFAHYCDQGLYLSI